MPPGDEGSARPVPLPLIDSESAPDRLSLLGASQSEGLDIPSLPTPAAQPYPDEPVREEPPWAAETVQLGAQPLDQTVENATAEDIAAAWDGSAENTPQPPLAVDREAPADYQSAGEPEPNAAGRTFSPETAEPIRSAVHEQDAADDYPPRVALFQQEPMQQTPAPVIQVADAPATPLIDHAEHPRIQDGMRLGQRLTIAHRTVIAVQDRRLM